MTTALVTGPTAGIGRAFAERCARAGLDLVLVSRDVDRLTTLAGQLQSSFGVKCEVIGADLASRSDLLGVTERLKRGDVRILINNAGFGLRTSFIESEIDEEQRMLDVLVTATMQLTHAALPAMQQAGFGLILNVSSVAGWTTGGTYAAAKSWVTVFSEGLASQVRPSGVRVVAVCPGFVRTEFHERALMDVERIPHWLWLTPEQVVDHAFADAARDRVVSVAGIQYSLIATALQIFPRGLIRWASPMRRTLVRRK